jgi:hypothetical protein
VLAAVVLLLTFEIGSLVTLGHPFDPVARVQPDAMTGALGLLESGRPGAAELRSCGPPATLSS